VLSAELLPPRLSKWLWRPASTRARRLAVYTFRRAPSNPASWHPRRVTLAAPADALLAQWASAINAAAAAQPRRPRRLLVLINPFGGRRRAGALYDRVVAPVLERAGVKATAVATRFAGDARDTLLGARCPGGSERAALAALCPNGAGGRGAAASALPPSLFAPKLSGCRHASRPACRPAAL
jgi:hypothetical protein